LEAADVGVGGIQLARRGPFVLQLIRRAPFVLQLVRRGPFVLPGVRPFLSASGPFAFLGVSIGTFVLVKQVN
jgi:hypothetical protein